MAHSVVARGLIIDVLARSYDAQSVRLWAPSNNGGQSSGTIINVGHGWGNEAYAQNSEEAAVSVRIYEEPPPDFDSGYFEFKSQDGSNSFKKVAHGLGEYPGRVKVMVKAVSGNNAGYDCSMSPLGL